MLVANTAGMTWLRAVPLSCLVWMAACDGDPCDVDEQCFSSTCDYGSCGSTLVTVIASVIEDATEDEEDLYYEEPEYAAPRRQTYECRAFTCSDLDVDDCERSGCTFTKLGCGEEDDIACALQDLDECTAECPLRSSCDGEPTICEGLDFGECFSEPACAGTFR